MTTVIRQSYPVARKPHECNACLYIRDALDDRSMKFEISDLRKIVLARRSGWYIQPGERYLLQVQADDGNVFNVCCKPEMDDICRRYNLYPEWD